MDNRSLTGDRTYFVRVRVSSNAGSTWGPWSTQFWPYSYYPATPYEKEGWYFTTQEQFQLGTVNETAYNFLSIQNNGTSYPDDDFFRLEEGTFTITSGSSDGVREGGSWFNTQTYMTMGRRTSGCTHTGNFWNGMNYLTNIPNSAVINSADFSVVASGSCPCNVQSATLNMIFDAHAADNGPALNGTSVADLANRTTANQVISYATPWTNGNRYTMLSVSNILQEIVNRPGWQAGNSFNLLARWDPAYTPTGTHNRCLNTNESGVANAPRIQGTFTNFYNTIRFPSVNRAIYGPDATAWDELRVTDNTVGCGTCYVEYRIHDAGTNAVLAGPFLRPSGMSGAQYFDISSVGATNIYVATRVYRNNTPVVHDIWLTTTDVSPLPVEWKSVEGTCLPNGNEIKWSTASEQNNDYFTVERTLDGVKWTSVCQVPGAGTSNNTNEYVCVDQASRSDLYYYRVRQTDYDGQSKVSDIISLNCQKHTELVVYPNPNQGQFILEGGRLGMGVVLYDHTGRAILKKEINSHTTEFDVSTYSKGVYLLKVNEDEYIQTFKIVVN